MYITYMETDTGIQGNDHLNRSEKDVSNLQVIIERKWEKHY